jgi:hemerythrin-like domain-containing protein
MNATDALKNEHRVIEQVLNCLEKMANRCLARGSLDKDSARKVIDFLENFAHRYHHGKEERCLFPLLEARGIPRDHGPIGVMIHEHEHGRQHIEGMIESLSRGGQDERQSQVQFVEHARAYIRLVREHIWKEDNHLFPMAERVLTDEELSYLESSFEQAEAGEKGLGVHEKYLELADELADRFNVPYADLEMAAPGCVHSRYAAVK